jgi:hypothetical protein
MGEALSGNAYADGTGLHSIMWRQSWESSRDATLKERLLNYNMEDCLALNVLTDELRQLLANPRLRADVCMADEKKTPASAKAAEIHGAFTQVLRSAYSDYSKSRIRLGEIGGESRSALSHKGAKVRRVVRQLPRVKGRTVQVPRKKKCQRHPEQPTWLSTAFHNYGNVCWWAPALGVNHILKSPPALRAPAEWPRLRCRSASTMSPHRLRPRF